MNQLEYIIKCTTTPPGVVYIGEKSVNNEFCIEFEKIPLDYSEYNQSISLNNSLTQEGEQAAIYINADFGDGMNDLCTKEQASKLTFTTLDGEGWEMEWSDTNSLFVVHPPDDFGFPDSYRASFRSNGFYTEAKAGTSTLKAYFVNFLDVLTKVEPIDIYKRYPIRFEYFKAEPDTVAVGGTTTLSWRVQNALKCFIFDIGQVDVEGSKEVTVTAPMKFHLSAENDMGKTDWAEIQVYCRKPTIKLWTDHEFYHSGDEITLFWESTSAVSVQILPFPGQVGSSGSIKVTPEGAATYIATAHGYDGLTPFDAVASVTPKKTPWKCAGSISGVDLAMDTLNVDRRVWEYQGNYYLFSNSVLYESLDTLTWSQLSEFILPDGFKLENYSTIVTNDTFLVLGLTKTDSTFVQTATYDFGKKTWSTGDAMPTTSNVGGILSKLKDKPYYAKLKNTIVMFYTQIEGMEGKWGNQFFLKDKSMDELDFSSSKERLYVAVRDSSSHIVTIKSIIPKDLDWSYVGRVEKPVNGWFCMIPTMREFFLLSQNQMLNLDTFKSVSDFHPPLDTDYLPWSGSCNITPFLITKSGVLWRCEE